MDASERLLKAVETLRDPITNGLCVNSSELGIGWFSRQEGVGKSGGDCNWRRGFAGTHGNCFRQLALVVEVARTFISCIYTSSPKPQQTDRRMHMREVLRKQYDPFA